MVVGVIASPTAAASSFADPAFRQTWQTIETAVPDFWGPLESAKNDQQEPYQEAGGGQRLVQYFDKARMELTIPALSQVSTGLLTIELKTGALQMGALSFERRQPARIGLVGDPNSSGPTYADLALLPKKDGRPGSSPPPYFYRDGTFQQAQNVPARAGAIPLQRFSYRLDDPSGRYSQYVFSPFCDFIQSLPLPLDQTTGYAISPLIWVHAVVGGKPTEVLVQAFERRVLTRNDSGPVGKEVEFGNIGHRVSQSSDRLAAGPHVPRAPLFNLSRFCHICRTAVTRLWRISR